MAREKVKQVQVFSLPTEYERQAAEARRREMMAEMLAQQAYDPGQYQGAPIPKAAPVVKALEGYLRGREMRKAREAGEKAEAEVSRAGQQIMGRLMGGAPIAEPVMPDASGLDEVRVQSQYRASPDDAMRMAMTPVGSAAMRGNPALAAMLAKTMERPEAEEFYAPIETEGGLVQFGKRGGRKDTGVQAAPEEMTPYQKEQIRIEEERLAFQRSKAGQAEGRAKAPSGYRYNETGELEPIPGGPQDPNRPMTMPLAARNNIITEQDNSRQFAIASQRTNKFINDIQSGKLPLYKGASVVYAAERALDRNKSYSEENRPPYDRYYELDRFVTEQVNMILSRAKGPQTDQDALRARQQILDNLDNKQVVTTALKTLDRLWNDEINLSESTINDWYSQYNQSRPLNKEDIEALNWANSNPSDPRAAEIKSRLGGRR